MYASAGDGCHSFTFADWASTLATSARRRLGQGANARRIEQVRAVAPRSQDLGNDSDPTVVDCAILAGLDNPDTGRGAAPGDLYAGGPSTPPVARIVAEGLRNLFLRSPSARAPASSCIGDVGGNTWEEIDRTPVADACSTRSFLHGRATRVPRSSRTTA